MSKKPYNIIHNVADDPYISYGSSIVNNTNEYWSCGADNMLPQAIANLNRKANNHRAILNSKTKYITGKNFTCDEKNIALVKYLSKVNNHGENLKAVFSKLIFDKLSGGNAWIELVTNAKHSFLNIFHHDATTARASKKNTMLLHPQWFYFNGQNCDTKQIPMYPKWADTEGDGNLRSAIHIKDYEQEFVHYGLCSWIAGLGVAAIAWKTDKWNISRLDNNFNTSGVLVVDGTFENPADEEEFSDYVQTSFSGENVGKILTITKTVGGQENGTKFTPINTNSEGDWQNLHRQSTDDLIIAHNWFKSLTGISENTGFDTKKILNDYNVAISTIVTDEQERFTTLFANIIQDILRIDASSLSIINQPPLMEKQPYMFIWECRKADGLTYDENDPSQNIYLASLTKPATNANVQP